MSADVGVTPAVQLWTQITATHLASCGGEAPPPGLCETMLEPDQDQHVLEAQMSFFRKLGYSAAQVRAVQQKFGADTDKVLGQLVRGGAGGEAEPGPVTTVSVLVSRGDPRSGGPELLLPVSDSSPPSRELRGEDRDALRAVVIDGSNVAMSHGNKEVFSCLGIQLAVNFFRDRGHTDITVFVPSWRKEQPRPDVPITDQHILRELEKKKILVFTPSRRVAGRRVVCNDDCFIVKHGFESDGVVVSNDMYRDLQGERPEWRRFIEERLLMYSFVNNKFMVPDDPLGRHGPTLENFLRKFPKTQKKQPCPYGKKCTYGIKCKFSHPERAKQSNRALADDLRQSARSPGVDAGLLQVTDMAKKLSLAPEAPLAKKQEPRAHVRGGHRSKKSQAKKDRALQQTERGGSHEQLDSGLGSIDSHRSAPCGSYSPGPFQPPSMGPVSSRSADFPSYSHPAGSIYGRSAYSEPPGCQYGRVQPHYWSEPPGARPQDPHSLQGDPKPAPGRKEREVVRKKLLAIFSAPLVDKAMDMFPHLLDPQLLVAEILMLQGQSGSQR